MAAFIPKCFAIAFSLMILANAVLVRKLSKTWLVPACIFSLFWFVFSFLPLTILFEVPVDPFAMAYIFLCTTIFSISSLFFRWNIALSKNSQKKGLNKAFNKKFMYFVFYVSSIASVICLGLNMFTQGITLYDLFFNIFGAAEKYASMRYGGDLTPNIFGQLNLVLSYIAVTTGGLISGGTTPGWGSRGIVFFAFLPSIGVMIFQSAKGLFFLSVALFFGGVLVARIYDNNLYLINKRTIKNVILSSFIIVPAVVISFLSRGLHSSNDIDLIMHRLLRYLVSYAFGSIYAFSDWFSSYIGSGSAFCYRNENISYGFYTFMSIFKSIGIKKTIPPGVFDHFFTYKDLLVTNIYTVFRGLILDFGIFGSFVYIFIVGSFLHASFFVMLHKKNPLFSVAIYVFMIGYIYMTYLISMLMWSVIPVSFVLLCFVLVMNRIRVFGSIKSFGSEKKL